MVAISETTAVFIDCTILRVERSERLSECGDRITGRWRQRWVRRSRLCKQIPAQKATDSVLLILRSPRIFIIGS